LNLRALFLILVGAEALHLSSTQVGVAVGGYYLCSEVDAWLAGRRKKRKARRRMEALDDVLFGWERDPDDPDSEIKDDWSRFRLDGQFQILAARVSDLLRGLLVVDLVDDKRRKGSSLAAPEEAKGTGV